MGFRLLASHSIDTLSIDAIAKEAGVSRGLLYHYFGDKHGFLEAVVQHVADDLYARTAPPSEGTDHERLVASINAYVDYVTANPASYRAFRKATLGGNDALREIYDTTFTALVDRFFVVDIGFTTENAELRLMLHAWQAMTEDLVMTWCETPSELSRSDVTEVIINSLPALIESLPESAQR